uniref:Uncharacterized protein n=1 Tax=viral metagenome TaxID=1070528 RepID=A0A6M3M9T9_9ZZZZ
MDEKEKVGNFWINKENSPEGSYLSVSGKFNGWWGIREYHRMGHFKSETEAEKFIEELKTSKKGY